MPLENDGDRHTPPDTLTAMAAAVSRIDRRVEQCANWSLAAYQTASRVERAVERLERVGRKAPFTASVIAVLVATASLLIALSAFARVR